MKSRESISKSDRRVDGRDFSIGRVVQSVFQQRMVTFALAFWIVSSGTAMAQRPIVVEEPEELFFAPDPSHTMRDYSWTFVDIPEPSVLEIHDIVTIIVDEKAEVTSNSRFNRSKNLSLKAELKEFMRINEDGNLGNAASNQPAIDATLNERAQSQGQATQQEGVRYRIAAMVVDVYPNGTLVLESRKTIRIDRDVWSYRLTGSISSEKINRDGTALSEHIYGLRIEKDSRGKVSDSTSRKWGTRLYDMFFPF